jgi:hypothetical protein
MIEIPKERKKGRVIIDNDINKSCIAWMMINGHFG